MDLEVTGAETPCVRNGNFVIVLAVCDGVPPGP
jgi:hypothetical protein